MPGGKIPFEGGGKLHEFHRDTSSDRATVTTAEFAYYANGTSGSDDNDGLTAATAKKTRAAALALVPDVVKHNGSVNFAGTFSTAENIRFTRYIEDAMFIVTGEADWTIVDDNSGAKYTTTAGTGVGALVVNGAGWTGDEHMHLCARILTGAAAGEIIQVQQNDDDTITPIKNFAANPGVGATFELVEPKTTIDVSSGTDSMRFSISGGRSAGTFNLVLQRLTTKGTKPQIAIENSSGNVLLTNLSLQSTADTPLWFIQSLYVATTDYAYSTSTFAFVWPQTEYMGVSVKGNSGPCLKCNTCSKLILDAIVVETGSEFYNILQMYAASGFWLKGANEFKAVCTEEAYGLRANAAGYATGGAVNAAGSNIVFEGCSLITLTGGNYGNAGAHGLEVLASYLRCKATVAGANNTDAGVYAHSGSQVLFDDGSPPTITGTVGDLSFDGTTEASTWANVDAGNAVSDVSEMSMCKEV